MNSSSQVDFRQFITVLHPRITASANTILVVCTINTCANLSIYKRFSLLRLKLENDEFNKKYFRQNVFHYYIILNDHLGDNLAHEQ